MFSWHVSLIECSARQWRSLRPRAFSPRRRGRGESGPHPESHARKGKTDGIWYWTLPNTPNGLRPVQKWSGAGSTPDGEIFVAGMDHVRNSALYRLRDQVLRYVGDARSASQAANNWKPGEVVEKFTSTNLGRRPGVRRDAEPHNVG